MCVRIYSCICLCDMYIHMLSSNCTKNCSLFMSQIEVNFQLCYLEGPDKENHKFTKTSVVKRVIKLF